MTASKTSLPPNWTSSPSFESSPPIYRRPPEHRGAFSLLKPKLEILERVLEAFLQCTE